MDGKNRNTEEIAAFCRKYDVYCENVRSQAKQLMMVAQAAESGLRDEVGREAIQRVYEFCNEVINIVYQGEQPIRELERRNRQIEDDMEKLRGGFGR